MKILFVIDKLEFKYFEFNKLVTNFWLIVELLKRGYEVFVTTNPNLYLKGNCAYTKCYRAFLKDGELFREDAFSDSFIENFKVAFFRPDPPVDIDYINAHGTSTHVGDLSEIKAISKVFADCLTKGLMISSTKSMHGHLLGGSGAIESIACIKAMQEGIVPF